MATEPRRQPLDRALDLVLFAPLGLVLTIRDQIPHLAQQGRKRFQAQSGLARMVGEMAVKQGRRHVSDVIDRVRPPAPGSPAAGNGPAAQPRGEGAATGSGEAATVAVTTVAPGHPWPDAGGAPGTAAGGGGGHGGAAAASRPDASELPIPGYDSLSASQVVQRLTGLTPEELAVVRAYESAGRSRKTVLTRIHQLGA